MNSEKYVGLDVHQAADIGEHAGKALLLWSVTSRLFRHWLNGAPPFLPHIGICDRWRVYRGEVELRKRDSITPVADYHAACQLSLNEFMRRRQSRSPSSNALINS